jgi:hypothetical protein
VSLTAVSYSSLSMVVIMCIVLCFGGYSNKHLGNLIYFRHHYRFLPRMGNLFIHLAVCLTTGPKPLSKRALHIVRSRASSFKCEYPLLSLRSSNSFVRPLPCLPVTSIPPCIFPSITRCRRQFLRKCDQSSSPFVYVFHVGYSSAP